MSGIMSDRDSPADVQLRDVLASDLPIFFVHQLDPVANNMVAFTVEDPSDRVAFDARWARILADDSIAKKTVLVDGQVAGHVTGFEQFGKPSVGYWLGREFWGRGIATRALAAFIDLVETRPLYARAASDNVGSIRVLEKCGFTITGTDRGFAHARGAEIDEVILILREPL
jgi:RimJ/RimL family protein N-acetyltransferase